MEPNSPIPVLARYLGTAVRALGAPFDNGIYVVGGAVRNHVLGLPPKDLDLVVDSVVLGGYDAKALAQYLASSIPAAVSQVTNQYGVAILTVKGPWELEGVSLQGEVLEIATARTESYGGAGGKGYKPHLVEPATIEEDLRRREFTCNTLLWRLADLTGELDSAPILDLTGRGLTDLQARQLCTPSDPDRTFSDDPTRMLRAFKFVLRYGFSLSSEVEESIRRNATGLHAMPADAVAKIWLKDILTQPRAPSVLPLLDRVRLTSVLADLTRTSKPFRAFVTSELRTVGVELLLDLADRNLEGDSSIGTFFLQDRNRIRALGADQGWEKAQQLYGALLKPPLDSESLIQHFKLEPRQRSVLVPAARAALLNRPELAGSKEELTRAVRASLTTQLSPL